jgi:hypothetical protein
VDRIKFIVSTVIDEAGVANRAERLPDGFVYPGPSSAKFQSFHVTMRRANVLV